MKSLRLLPLLIIYFTVLILSCQKDDGSDMQVNARFTTPIIKFGEVTFRNYSENATEYKWEFGDGNTSTEKDPVHNYQTLGEYQVKLTASHENESDIYLLKVVIGQIFPENLTQLDDLPFGGRTQLIYFTKDDIGYIAAGIDYSDFQFKKDMWKFDPSSYSWELVTDDFPIEINNGASFVIGEKAYFGFGSSNSFTSDIYSYNFSNQNFELDHSFPETPNTSGVILDPVCFEYDGFGYLIGRGQSNWNSKKMWKFDPMTQEWETIGNYACAGNAGMFHVILDERLIIGMGNENGYTFFDNRPDIWEYDLVNNSWSQKNDFPGVPRRDGISFTHNGKGYFGFGSQADPLTGESKFFSDLWEYDLDEDSWEKILDMPVPNKQELFAFKIGNSLFFGGGNNGVSSSPHNFYELKLE